jgi:FkbM family methyltransferase
MTDYLTSHGVIRCYKNDDAFVKCMVTTGKVYEEDIVYNYVKPYILQSKVILDIGAHIGSHTVMYANINPEARIYAFEPQTKIFDLLKHNTSGYPNVQVFNNAVGHKTFECHMDAMVYDGYNHTVEYGTDCVLNLGGVQLGMTGETTKMLPIDSLHLDGCDYIKVDTEGAEHLVFTGAMHTLTRYKPVIFFEKNNKQLSKHILETYQATHIPSSIDILKGIGYTLTELPGQNILARHPDR